MIDTRRYQRMIGLIGLALVAALSVYLFVNHRGSSTTGVTAGHRLRWFAAPLATSDLRGAANLHPPCTLDEHDPRALNLCIDAGRGPIVLSLFVLGGGSCERQVDSLQTLARRFAGSTVQFEAVALNASRPPPRGRSVPITGRSRSPTTRMAASASSTASWPARWSSWRGAVASSSIA